MINCTNTYWNGNGKEQSKYNEMREAGFEFTKAALCDMHRYYRYYNDGDMPGWARGRWELKTFSGMRNCWKLNERGEEELERRATETILREYKRFQKSN